MDPFAYPDDALLGAWVRRYGTTGVKMTELALHPDNAGCVAVYREMSMQERGMFSRLEEIEDDAPGAFDYMRVIVASCLLYPTVDAYPDPPFAVAELFGRIRQHGHGPIAADETHHGGIPEHMVVDFRNARRVAHATFHDPRYASIYRYLIVDLASIGGKLDIQLYDYLWQQPPGRLRDILSNVEQANLTLREGAFELLKEIKDRNHLKAASDQIEATYPNIFAGLDEETEGATRPDFKDVPVDEEDAAAADTGPVYADDTLPPNNPTFRDELTHALEG